MATTIKVEDDVLILLKAHARRDEDYSAVISRLLSNSNWKPPTQKWYLVATPEMHVSGTRNFALVRVYTRKQARWAAYKVWKREGSHWIDESAHTHPLAGVTVEEEWDNLTEEGINQWEPFVERLNDGS